MVHPLRTLRSVMRNSASVQWAGARVARYPQWKIVPPQMPVPSWLWSEFFKYWHLKKENIVEHMNKRESWRLLIAAQNNTCSRFFSWITYSSGLYYDSWPLPGCLSTGFWARSGAVGRCPPLVPQCCSSASIWHYLLWLLFFPCPAHSCTDWTWASLTPDTTRAILSYRLC